MDKRVTPRVEFNKRLWIIAGEASGDALGAGLLRELKQLAEANHFQLQYAGIGGHLMQAEGLQSLFPMAELSVMGFIEVLRHAPRILRRLRQTAEAITEFQPDVIVTIDSYGFHSRLWKKLPRTLGKRVHYAAPTVWIYRPKRAQVLQQWVDELLTLFPFEPAYFEKVGLQSTCVGHPLASLPRPSQKAIEAFRSHHPHHLFIGMMPGSRHGEIQRLWPIYAAAIVQLYQHYPNLCICIPVLPQTKALLEARVMQLPCPVMLVEGEMRRTAMAALDFALTKSGTITLELALLGVPMVVAHRVNAFSAWLLRRLTTIRHVSLPNILLKQPIAQELLQEQCTADMIASAMNTQLQDQTSKNTAMQNAHTLTQLLKGAHAQETPDRQAALRVWQWLQKH